MALHSAESVSSEQVDNGEWTTGWTLGITLVCPVKTDPYVRDPGTGNREREPRLRAKAARRTADAASREPLRAAQRAAVIPSEPAGRVEESRPSR